MNYYTRTIFVSNLTNVAVRPSQPLPTVEDTSGCAESVSDAHAPPYHHIENDATNGSGTLPLFPHPHMHVHSSAGSGKSLI